MGKASGVFYHFQSYSSRIHAHTFISIQTMCGGLVENRYFDGWQPSASVQFQYPLRNKSENTSLRKLCLKNLKAIFLCSVSMLENVPTFSVQGSSGLSRDIFPITGCVCKILSLSTPRVFSITTKELPAKPTLSPCRCISQHLPL